MAKFHALMPIFVTQLDPVPVGSGSIAQVHKGTLHMWGFTYVYECMHVRMHIHCLLRQHRTSSQERLTHVTLCVCVSVSESEYPYDCVPVYVRQVRMCAHGRYMWAFAFVYVICIVFVWIWICVSMCVYAFEIVCAVVRTCTGVSMQVCLCCTNVLYERVCCCTNVCAVVRTCCTNVLYERVCCCTSVCAVVRTCVLLYERVQVARVSVWMFLLLRKPEAFFVFVVKWCFKVMPASCCRSYTYFRYKTRIRIHTYIHTWWWQGIWKHDPCCCQTSFITYIHTYIHTNLMMTGDLKVWSTLLSKYCILAWGSVSRETWTWWGIYLSVSACVRLCLVKYIWRFVW
jgi:hypothetical protein